VVDNKIWGQYDLLLADLDGVIYEGSVAIKNAVESINEITAQKINVGYVTNNSSRKPETIVQQLLELGLNAKPEEIISSGQTAVELLQTNGDALDAIIVPMRLRGSSGMSACLALKGNPLSNATRARKLCSKSSSPRIAEAVIVATCSRTPAFAARSSIASCWMKVESTSS
jgi:CheY-like chemotaxis protein